MWVLLTSRLAGPIASAVASLLAVVAVVLFVLLRQASADAARLDVAINNPESGYVVRLDRCGRNAAALSASLQDQNAKFDALSKDSASRLAEAEAAIARARTAMDKANAQAAVLKSRPPAGVDTCARVLDVDDRFVELLKQ
jgi:hypothetical protein